MGTGLRLAKGVPARIVAWGRPPHAQHDGVCLWLVLRLLPRLGRMQHHGADERVFG